MSYSKEYYKKNRKRILKKMSEYYFKNKNHIKNYRKRWYLQNKTRVDLKHKKYWQLIRKKILQAYGRKCQICSSTKRLTIDHINGDGGEERKTYSWSKTIYLYLIKHNFPKDRFRLLCFGCNISEYWRKKREHYY